MKNTTILLIGHGSRHTAGNKEIDLFSSNWCSQNPQWTIQTCFIEFAEVMLDQGLDKAAKNANKVIVLPLILNAAGHVKVEIPHHISHACERHPDVEFVYAEHLGATDSILTILKRNLGKTLFQMDMPDPKTTGIILLARGASDREANGEVVKMARWLYDETEHELVDVAFTGITHPRLELAVQRQFKLGMLQIVILPYYLFTGTLMERIHRQVTRLQGQYPEMIIANANYFGFEPEIYDMLNKRVEQALDSGYVSKAMQKFATGDVIQHHHSHAHNHTDEKVNA